MELLKNRILVFKCAPSKTEGERYQLSRRCISCSTVVVSTVKSQDYFNWNRGQHAQHAFPYLSLDDREILISGFCGKCFDNLFKGEN
jgi:hypothetical protein